MRIKIGGMIVVAPITLKDIVLAILTVVSYFFGKKNGRKSAYRRAAGLDREI